MIEENGSYNALFRDSILSGHICVLPFQSGPAQVRRQASVLAVRPLIQEGAREDEAVWPREALEGIQARKRKGETKGEGKEV